MDAHGGDELGEGHAVEPRALGRRLQLRDRLATVRLRAAAAGRAIAMRGMWIGRAAGLAAALGAAAMTWQIGTSQPWGGDNDSDMALRQARSLASGIPMPADNLLPEIASHCGLFHIMHHPIGSSYLLLPAMWLGFDPGRGPLIGIAVATAVLLGGLAWASPIHALLAAAYVFAMLSGAIGYYGWLTNVYQHTWDVTLLYLLAAAALLRRPWWPVAVLCGCIATVGYDAVFVQATVLAAVLVARHGFGRTTIVSGLAGLASFVALSGVHLIQVACVHEWSWTDAWDDWGNRGLFSRMSPLKFSDRLIMADEVSRRYGTAILQPQWSSPWVLLAGGGLLALCPITWRGNLAAIVVVLGYVAWAIVAPFHVGPHEHLLVRWLLFGPLMMLVAEGAAYSTLRRGAAPAVQ